MKWSYVKISDKLNWGFSLLRFLNTCCVSGNQHTAFHSHSVTYTGNDYECAANCKKDVLKYQKVCLLGILDFKSIHPFSFYQGMERFNTEIIPWILWIEMLCWDCKTNTQSWCIKSHDCIRHGHGFFLCTALCLWKICFLYSKETASLENPNFLNLHSEHKFARLYYMR